MADRYSPRVRAFMYAVTALSLPVVVLSGWQAVELGVEPLLGHLGIVVLLFSAVLIAGEMWPIPVSRGEESSDEITVSSTFGFALLLVAPVFFTILAQAVALVIDWRVRGSDPRALLFNVGKYAFAFTGARAVYALAAGEPFTLPACPSRACWRRSSPAPPSSSSTTASSGWPSPCACGSACGAWSPTTSPGSS